MIADAVKVAHLETYCASVQLDRFAIGVFESPTYSDAAGPAVYDMSSERFKLQT